MILARVLGNVVATAHHPSYDGHKLMVYQPVDESGADCGPSQLAIDTVQAGPGDLVLVMREGNGVRQILAQATPRRRINAEPPTWAAGRDGDGQVADPQQMISFDPVWEPAELGIGSRARPSVA